MQVLEYVHRWLAAPPGTNHLVAAVFAVALIWVALERFGNGPKRAR